MKLEFTLTPSASDINFITQKINEDGSDFGSAYPFAFFIRDKAKNIIAGCNGSVIFGCIYTDQLRARPKNPQKCLIWLKRKYVKVACT